MARLRETDRVFDELLLVAARAGDRRAADRLAARWHPRLMRTARRLLRDEELARDAVQDSWAAICKGWRGLKEPARFPAWAFTILHRRCADQIRAVQVRRNHLVLNGTPPDPGVAPRGEDRVALDHAFGALSADHRTAAILFFGEGLSLAEIASVTGVPIGTAKSRLFHARKQLRALLEGDPT